MTQTLTEDDIYRTSSQYKLWSFSPEGLASLRKKTHALAIERARRYSKDVVDSSSEAEKASKNSSDGVLDYLTLEEELRLVVRYCDQIRTTSDHFGWPVNVKATAVQYLKRFYLSNSCVTYPPKEIYKTVLFLACKTEATHMTLSEYARRISSEPEQILAPEYKIMQALRFTLDVRQAFRGLKGVLMELLNMNAGMAVLPAGTESNAADTSAPLIGLPAPVDGNTTRWTPRPKTEQKHVNDRIEAAYSAARQILDAPALLTDVYLLFTPSQILLAALGIADTPLFESYIATKLSAESPVRTRILGTIAECAEMLWSFSQATIMKKEERADLEKKLELCRDPGTKDLVKAHAAIKRDGEEDGTVDEAKAKRRKLERERSLREGADLFGPTLKSAKAANA